MPRKSAASLTVRGPVTPCRADAPPAVRAIFGELVGSVPGDHFRPGDGALLSSIRRAILLARGCTDEEIIELRDGFWRRAGIARRDVLAQARRLIDVVSFDDLSAPSSVALQ